MKQGNHVKITVEGASGQITSTKHLCIFVGRGGDLPNGYLYAV